ncbi:DMT family transporter [Candidatus Halocynthiibacter alkanivorans]|uniref:DMT family transporter n=1 Tax=Candidatus Halocynthiibacter alkanivorans TaxID=2267619 RepID=UPI000DF424B9|nr:DMT family transporter [Candidatus Halocynthiibacter alkanivorans]
MSLSQHTASARNNGVSLVIISALVFSTAGVFTNGVETDAWGVIFWRGVAAAGFTLLYMGARGTLGREIRAFGKPALLVTCLMAAGTAAFIPAFKLSSVANVALIYAAAPFVAAGLSWMFIREAPARTVIIASIAAFAGVLTIVSGSVGQPQLTGDALALFMTLMMAGTMVVYRARPGTTAALPAALSSIALLPLAAIFGQPFEIPASELPVLVLFGLVFAVASVTLSEGARRLPSAETALLSALEVPLAPILAWAVLSEIPSLRILGGGAVIFLAVIWSQPRKTN